MDLSIRLRVIYNVKHRYVICLEFGDKFLTFLTKLVLEAKVLQVTIIIGGFVNKPQSNSYSISVSENVYHWWKFNARSSDIFFLWAFDLILINSSIYFLLEIWFLITLKKYSKWWNKIKVIYSFICFRCWCWKILFFRWIAKNLYQLFSMFYEQIF